MAKVHFSKVLKIAPLTSSAWNNLGVIEFGCGNFNNAAILLRQAIKIQPDNKSAQESLEKILHFRKDENEIMEREIEESLKNVSSYVDSSNSSIVLEPLDRTRFTVTGHYAKRSWFFQNPNFYSCLRGFEELDFGSDPESRERFPDPPLCGNNSKSKVFQRWSRRLNLPSIHIWPFVAAPGSFFSCWHSGTIAGYSCGLP